MGRRGWTPRKARSRGGGCAFTSSFGEGGTCGVENVGTCGKIRRRGAGTELAGSSGEEGEMIWRPPGVVKDDDGVDDMREACVRNRERRR